MTAPDTSLPALVAWHRERAQRAWIDSRCVRSRVAKAEFAADAERHEATAAALERLIQLEGENGD